LAVADIASRLRDGPSGYRLALASTFPKKVVVRPEPEVWSALEYACHVRDMLLVQRDRAVLVQVEDRQSVACMHRDYVTVSTKSSVVVPMAFLAVIVRV
jgi:hypothetical protein